MNANTAQCNSCIMDTFELIIHFFFKQILRIICFALNPPEIFHSEMRMWLFYRAIVFIAKQKFMLC